MLDVREILNGFLQKKIEHVDLRVIPAEQPKKHRKLRLEVIFKKSDSHMIYERELSIQFRRKPKHMRGTKNM